MSKVFDTLVTVRDHLGALPGVATSRIGLEANMTPADYPMIRVVPAELVNGPTLQRTKIRALIYFGKPIHEFTEAGRLEDLYSELFDMEASIIAALRTIGGGILAKQSRTILDEDRVDAYKLMCMQVEISGA